MDSAHSYVHSLELPEPPPQLEAAESAIAFDTEPEVVAVGAQLAEFSKQVSPAQRATVADCLLLAQLAANKASVMNADLMAWYGKYLEVLQNIGWVSEQMEFKESVVEDLNADVHKAIIPVLTSMLGPAAAAASMVVGVLKGLQAMDQDNPWITLFDRSSTHVSGAKFQLGFVDADKAGGSVTIQLMALAIDAKKRITQVLFFKFSKEKAKLSVAQGTLGIGPERLQGISKAVGEKVAPFLIDNIGKIDL
jgi:hypothetical protein